jgi:hypothetical protein
MSTEHLLVSGRLEEEMYQKNAYLHGIYYRCHINTYIRQPN